MTFAQGPTEARDGDRDAEIGALVAEGNHREALARCAQAYAVPLGRMCMALTGSQSESEALVEQTLLAALDSLPEVQKGASVRAWLFGIARRVSGRHTETRSRTQGRGQTLHGSGSAPDRTTSPPQAAERVRAALSRLKPSEREAVVLRCEAGLSFHELSIACGVDEASARKRVSRGLARLRAELGERS
jgi:RNA polymerase sigma-70 factor (ECF subfamily)